MRKAHQAIKEEYTLLKALDSLVKPSVIERKTAKYLDKKQASVKAIEMLEDFQWLYHHLRRQFKVIRSNGQVRPRQFAEGEAQAALDLLFEMPIDWKTIPEQVNKVFPDLFNFLDTAEHMQEQLLQLIEPSILPFWMSYWQYQRSLINLKKAAAKKRLKQRFQWLQHLLQQYEKQHPQLATFEKKCVFAHLNSVIQSSSIVECANSILRPYIQQAREQISQQMLNLIMFYHNHRIFLRGKRKANAPIELLTRKRLDHNWLDLLINKVKNNSHLI